MADALTPESASEPPRTVGVMLRRGCIKHCPRCGGGHVYEGWYRMKERCPTCGFRFEREPGFFVAAAFINLAITEGLLFLVMMGVIFALSRNPDAHLLVPAIVGGIFAVVGPIAFYPFSKTIWSAIDLSMTPLELEEIVAARDHLTRLASDRASEPIQPKRPSDRP